MVVAMISLIAGPKKLVDKWVSGSKMLIILTCGPGIDI